MSEIVEIKEQIINAERRKSELTNELNQYMVSYGEKYSEINKELQELYSRLNELDPLKD